MILTRFSLVFTANNALLADDDVTLIWSKYKLLIFDNGILLFYILSPSIVLSFKYELISLVAPKYPLFNYITILATVSLLNYKAFKYYYPYILLFIFVHNIY